MNHNNTRFSFIQVIEGLEGVIVIIVGYLSFFLRPLRDRWGLSKEQALQTFPGDEIVPVPKTRFTHAIEINAPSKYVWPWIAQIGQGKGGFYTYEALENLVGLNIYNSDAVLSEFQNPQIGDKVGFAPKDALPIVICDHGRCMAIENALDMDTNKLYNPKVGRPKNYLHLTWLWYVEDIDEKRSRFISRNRVDFSPWFKNKLMFGSFSEPIVFAMDRKMCLGIKKRAERLFTNSFS
ncbi:hypothetical protein NYZ99_16410 [Maribacter litopenaei]|uniref:Uncharacterized protein n=1 Tax=Maribacter litopenaei TaxID=2976127 RepID=A0ABY5Y636_9FLAO|nr:hypothetical protein [Maribacter litopenaei]UWX54478.1 hypothetical protein NYZ99_16410 [Maribacter litopenaei]